MSIITSILDHKDRTMDNNTNISPVFRSSTILQTLINLNQFQDNAGESTSSGVTVGLSHVSEVENPTLNVAQSPVSKVLVRDHSKMTSHKFD